jgi:hypothetical protein
MLGSRAGSLHLSGRRHSCRPFSMDAGEAREGSRLLSMPEMKRAGEKQYCPEDSQPPISRPGASKPVGFSSSDTVRGRGACRVFCPFFTTSAHASNVKSTPQAYRLERVPARCLIMPDALRIIHLQAEVDQAFESRTSQGAQPGTWEARTGTDGVIFSCLSRRAGEATELSVPESRSTTYHGCEE